MIQRLLIALAESDNEAADDMLLEAVRLGNEREQAASLEALIERETVHGLGGVIEQYPALPESIKLEVLKQIRSFYHALRECGRAESPERRVAAMKLIALGRQGKLAYVLSENLSHSDDLIAKGACDAMVALSRWINTESRNLQKGQYTDRNERLAIYNELCANRPDIEQAVARAMDVHRGRHGQELLRATLLLCDWPGSRTLGILKTTKHGGQSPMVRRLQQPPEAEHVDAFLLGASHGELRSHFGIAFSHIDEAPVLDALLRKTHWLKDHQLQLCMHQVSRGAWWGDSELQRDIDRRSPEDVARIGEWLAVSGTHDVVQDERMIKLLARAKDDFGARLRLFRIACARKRGASVALIRTFLNDPEERLVRMAAREIVRRRPADFENMLLQLMTSAPQSVRQVISRSIGHVGFDHFWERFDRMDRVTRRQAGKAMLKLLPDGLQRLARRLGGPIEQCIKALQIVQELNLAEPMRNAILPLCEHINPKVRSKAVSVLGELSSVAPEVLLNRVLNDTDGRVRSNAIEVLESKRQSEYVPLLTVRARSAHNRERANAIKALHRMKVGVASQQLKSMLQDDRSEHRISALWALRQIGFWSLINEVGRLAKEDTNLRVRRYAMAVLKNVADLIQQRRAMQAQPKSLAS